MEENWLRDDGVGEEKPACMGQGGEAESERAGEGIGRGRSRGGERRV